MGGGESLICPDEMEQIYSQYTSENFEFEKTLQVCVIDHSFFHLFVVRVKVDDVANHRGQT